MNQYQSLVWNQKIQVKFLIAKSSTACECWDVKFKGSLKMMSDIDLKLALQSSRWKQ